MNPPVLFACFFCGVDSRALLYFFVLFVASVILASIAFLVWAVSKGDFRNVERAKYDVFNDPESGQSQAVTVPPLPRTDVEPERHEPGN
jgi:nitrogen fixation-related uncharacterized protein